MIAKTYLNMYLVPMLVLPQMIVKTSKIATESEVIETAMNIIEVQRFDAHDSI